MKKLVITLTPSNYTIPFSEEALTWVFSRYTAEQKTKYDNDLAFCEAQGWIEPVQRVDVEGRQSVPNITEHSTVWVDLSINSFIVTFRGNNIDNFYNYFVNQNDNFKPIKDYYDANPLEGSYTASLED